jgi:hypothetical protein
LIEYDLGDSRHVKVEFTELPEAITIIEMFEPQNTYPEKEQRSG